MRILYRGLYDPIY